ncbi:MAG TPA: hypothetical protein DCG71_06535 [Brevundimonas sp.]|nr:hypothetical protein [Brevundimonas sp.]
MAETYWVSFTVRDKTTPRGTYDERRAGVIDALFEVSDGWWPETTSFVMFQSEENALSLAKLVKSKLDPDCDIALIGSPNIKTMKLVGSDENSLTVLKSLANYAVRV